MRLGVTDRKILKIAVPAIVSNITVPLLGLVDVAIAGHLGAASYIGAVAVGGLLFNIMYWLFGFLRMGTSGMTSQAYGRRDFAETTLMLARSVVTGLAIAVALLLLQYPVSAAAFAVIAPPAEVKSLAETYFNVCIWGAPAVLSLYAFTGWFIGMQNAHYPMYIAIAQNVVNIAASLLFVYVAGMKIEGIALGTLIAQYAGAVMAVLLWRNGYRDVCLTVGVRSVFDREKIVRFFKINRDIFFRTLCLIAVTVFFTSKGAGEGDVILAVNTLLMQLFTIFSYVMDGFAYAGEAMSGRLIGASDSEGLRRMVKRLFVWGVWIAALFTLLYAAGGEHFLHLLTDDEDVIAASDVYFYWTVAIPFCGFAAFLWDGIFVGATASRQMMTAMMIATVAFFAVYLSLRHVWGNHALWFAFIIYLSVRGAAEYLLWRRLPLPVSRS